VPPREGMSRGALLDLSIIGSKQNSTIKKEATPKRKGLKTKTSDEKRGNPKCKGLKTKTSDEIRNNPQNARGSK
jgi:hypothetical protein